MVPEEVNRQDRFESWSLVEKCGERVCLSKAVNATMTLDAKLKVKC
jgi:hypothetical protein